MSCHSDLVCCPAGHKSVRQASGKGSAQTPAASTASAEDQGADAEQDPDEVTSPTAPRALAPPADADIADANGKDQADEASDAEMQQVAADEDVPETAGKGRKAPASVPKRCAQHTCMTHWCVIKYHGHLSAYL